MTNEALADRLVALARELTAGLRPEEHPDKAFVLGIGVGCMLRCAMELRQNFIEDHPALHNAARDACHAVGLPWTDPRTGITHEPPAMLPSGVVVRDATREEQFEAILQACQLAVHEQKATHDCGEWAHGFRCGVCGRWMGHA
jgi:hypothetical protein